MISAITRKDSRCCVRFEFGDYQISLAMDNNCAPIGDWGVTRTNVMVFKGRDFQERVGQEELMARIGDALTSEELLWLMMELKLKSSR
jgi:hypothetical protein